MRDIFQGTRGAKLIDWLTIDSWIDSGLYNSWTRFHEWWGAYSTFFGRFEVKGFVRALNELACETLTLGVGGLLVVTHLRAARLRDRARQDQPAGRV